MASHSLCGWLCVWRLGTGSLGLVFSCYYHLPRVAQAGSGQLAWTLGLHRNSSGSREPPTLVRNGFSPTAPPRPALTSQAPGQALASSMLRGPGTHISRPAQGAKM